MIFLFYLVVIGAIFIGSIFIVEVAKERRDEYRIKYKQQRTALGKAEKALRNIANNSGNSTLEAQIALDELNNYYEKELL